jgi:CRISPR-associated endonuclease Csy4
MDHYLEIRVLPDPEFSEEMLMAALVAKLHRALGKEGRAILGSASLHMALSPARFYVCTVITRR